MTCDSYQQEKDKSIVKGHAYSLLDAYEFDYQGKKQRLIKIRNPWGHKEWAGAWCDNDQRWNAVSNEQKQQVGYARNDNDGSFFMDFAEFPHYYENFQICYFESAFKYRSKRIMLNRKKAGYFKVTLPETGVYYFAAN